MAFGRDLRTIARLIGPRDRAGSHAAWLEAFYAPQAGDYDRFRRRLLPGRDELVADLPLVPGATWVDLGGGTGHNLLAAGPRLSSLAGVVVVDLAGALLAVAEARRRTHDWRNVLVVRADATAPPLPDGSVDVITCTYGLTMMPAWSTVVERARRLLKPGGTIGVVDFHVSGPHAPAGRVRHAWWTRRIWPWWFAHARVHLSPAHLAALTAAFETVELREDGHRLPYLPGSRVPYYRFVGRRRADPARIQWRPRCTTSSRSCSAADAAPVSSR